MGINTISHTLVCSTTATATMPMHLIIKIVSVFYLANNLTQQLFFFGGGNVPQEICPAQWSQHCEHF